MSLIRSKSYEQLAADQCQLVLDYPNILEDVGKFDRANGHKPVFTRDVLQQAANDMATARDPITCEDKIFRYHVLGGGYTEIFSGGRNPCPVVGWTSSYRLAESAGKGPRYYLRETAPRTGVALVNHLRPDDDDTNPVRLSIAKMTPPVAKLALMSKWQVEMESHAVWRTMEKLLRAMTVKVENIVVLALGPPNSSSYEEGLDPRTSSQHLFACSIAKFLSAHYGESKDVPITAYDPAYSVTDMHLLSNLPQPIKIVSDPYQYLSIGPNTLVMCIGVPAFVPVFEIMADSLFPSGPAAMITREMHWQPWHELGQHAVTDVRVPRVAKMLDLYHEPLWLGKDIVHEPGSTSLIEWLWSNVLYTRMQ